LRLGITHQLVRVPHVLAYYHHHGGEQITRNHARIALNHWHAQQKYLRANPSVQRELGAKQVAQLTAGELLHRGYASYWARDLPAARKIFRVVMKQGMVRPKTGNTCCCLAARIPSRVDQATNQKETRQ
jgi:hypothetical protein